MAEDAYSAYGGIPTGIPLSDGQGPASWADFWKVLDAQRAQEALTSERAKNISAGQAPAPAVTPGPEAFKQAPSVGGTDLQNMDLSGDFGNRAVTAAMEPVLGGAQLGARAAEALASGFGYYPNAASDYIGSGRAAVADAADRLTRAGQEQSRSAGYEPDNVSILHPSTWDPARTAGALLSPANIAAGRAGAAVGEALIPARVVPAAVAGAAPTIERTAGNVMATGAGAAVGTGAVQPVAEKAIGPNTTPEEKMLAEAESTRDYWMEQIKRGAVNGAIGSVIPMAARQGGNMLGGIVPENVRTLLDAYVRLTPGQIAGGPLQHVETLAESLPLTGWAIRTAKGRAQQDLPYAMSARALREAGEPVLPRGLDTGELMSRTYAGMRRAYTRSLTDATAPMDSTFFNAVHQNLYDAGLGGLPPDLQHNFSEFVERTITNRMRTAGPGQPLTGQAIKDIESDISKEMRKFGKSGEPYNQTMAESLGVLRDTFMTHVENSSPPGVRQQIAATNGGYMTYKQLQKSLDNATMAKAEGRLVPSKLASAVRASDRSVGNRAWDENRVKNQDLSNAAQVVMTDRVNDSGTAGRLAWAGLVHGLVHGGAGATSAGGSLAADAMGAAAYSTPMQAIIRTVMTGQFPGRAAVGQAIGDYGPQTANVLLQTPSAQGELRERVSPNPALAAFGKVRDASAAGSSFFNSGKDVSGAKKALAQLSPEQRGQFSAAYAGDLTRHVMEAKDPRTAMNTWTDSPQARQHMEAAMGPNKAHQLEAIMRLEGLNGIVPLMAKGESAVKLGASGAIPDYNSLLVHAIKSGGAATGKTFKDESVRKVAALLSSRDTEQFAKGIKQLANSPMMDAIRSFDKDLVKRGLVQPAFLRNESEKTVGTVQPAAVVPPKGMGPTERAAMQAAEDRAQPPKPAETPPEPGAMRVPGKDGWYKQINGKYYKWQG